MNAIESMPLIDYAQLATKQDLNAQLTGGMAGLRGELHGELGKVRTEAANNLRMMMASQFATAALIIGWISAST